MGDTYREDVAAYDNLRNRGGGSGVRPGPQGGGMQGGADRGGGEDAPKFDDDKKEKRDRIVLGDDGTETGGSSPVSYSSGSSYGGGGSDMSFRDSRLISQGESLYYQLWGEYPASGYVKALVKKGLNIFEIEDHERRKPAFKKTDTYQDEYMAYAKMVSRIMGTR